MLGRGRGGGVGKKLANLSNSLAGENTLNALNAVTNREEWGTSFNNRQSGEHKSKEKRRSFPEMKKEGIYSHLPSGGSKNKQNALN